MEQSVKSKDDVTLLISLELVEDEVARGTYLQGNPAGFALEEVQGQGECHF